MATLLWSQTKQQDKDVSTWPCHLYSKLISVLIFSIMDSS